MDRERLRSWGPGLVVGVAAVALAQAGIVSAWRSGREATLEREIAELRSEGQRVRARLGREVRTARLQAQRMRTGLAQARAQVSMLRVELADARAVERTLRRRVEDTSEALRSEPPALGLRIAPIDPLSGLVAIADNEGQQPIRIAESEGRLWIGDLEETLPPGASDLAVGPGEEVDLLDFPLLAWASGPVASGDVALRGALCLVYAREAEADPVEWAREVWFEYRPQSGGAALLHQDRWAPWPGEVACDLASAPRPW